MEMSRILFGMILLVQVSCICFIPKKIDAKTVHDDKPICLTHCAYKIRKTQIGTSIHYLQTFLYITTDKDFISKFQTALVNCRMQTDTSVIANEFIDKWKRMRTCLSNLTQKRLLTKLIGIFWMQSFMPKALASYRRNGLGHCIASTLLDAVFHADGFDQLQKKWIRILYLQYKQDNLLSPILLIDVLDCFNRLLLQSS